tara:strand:- start:3280 stop:3774 length:495 start_codon:yes stop_codon:yes gene_type:complete
MKKQEKEKKKDNPKKKPKKLLFIILGISVVMVAGVAIFLSVSKDKLEVKEPIKKQTAEKKIQQQEVTSLEKDSVSVIDTVKIENLTVNEELTTIEEYDKPPKVKINKVDHQNNPSNWKLVPKKSDDTSFYVIKNKITGTVLYNRYYDKKIGSKELNNFKKILSK